MTYREQLNKVNELDCVLHAGAYTAEDFERLCGYAVSVYLKSEELTANAIALCIGGMLSELGYTVDEITQIGKWKFIGNARGYM